MSEIYNKYISRGGEPAFTIEQPEQCVQLLNDIFMIASSDDYIRDMKINEKLSSLLTIIMSKSWHPNNKKPAQKRGELSSVKAWLDGHYTEKINLDELARQFFIDKYYLTKIFKEQYGTTINAYISRKRITAAKQLLRFSDKTIEQISAEIGISDTNYFTRLFKKNRGHSLRRIQTTMVKQPIIPIVALPFFMPEFRKPILCYDSPILSIIINPELWDNNVQLIKS